VAFPYLFDQRTWEPIEERLIRIAGMADRLEDPPKAVSSYVCSDCEYLEECEPPLPKRKTGGMGAPRL
jgi:hypothetical protein